MTTYTVLGLLNDTGQRWADHIEAGSPEEAEREAQRRLVTESWGWMSPEDIEDIIDHEPPLADAGVIEGAHECVDDDPIMR